MTDEQKNDAMVLKAAALRAQEEAVAFFACSQYERAAEMRAEADKLIAEYRTLINNVLGPQTQALIEKLKDERTDAIVKKKQKEIDGDLMSAQWHDGVVVGLNIATQALLRSTITIH